MTPAGARPGAAWRIHVVAVLLAALFLSLGSWQLARRSWKLDLIARVTARVHMAPVPAPPPAQWTALSAADSEYTRVRLHGHWLPQSLTLVAGASVMGSGYWQLVPLRTDSGWLVLVNRGFVASLAQGAASAPAQAAEADVTGLLRLSEPRGRFLRHNDPPNGRWYSRDVAAIAAARGLGAVAPYFVDAEAAEGALPDGGSGGRSGPRGEGGAPMPDDGERPPPWPADGAPVAGLTVIDFPNNHLAYAITWYALAAMVALGWHLWRREEHEAPQAPAAGAPR